MTELNLFSVVTYCTLQGFCLLILIYLLIATVLHTKHEHLKMSGKIIGVYISYAFVFLSDIIWILLEWMTPSASVFAYSVNIIWFSFTVLAAAFWYLYAEEETNPDFEAHKGRYFLTLIPCVLLIGLAISAPLNGLLFTINAAGKYERGPWMLCHTVVMVVYLLLTSLCALRRSKSTKMLADKRVFNFIALYAIPIMFFGLFQTISGYAFLCIGAVISLSGIYFFLIRDTRSRMLEIQNALSDEFQAVFLVDVDNDSIRSVRVEDDYNNSVLRVDKETSYRARIIDGIKNNAMTEDKLRLATEFDAEHIYVRLRGDASYSITYRVHTTDDNVVYHRAKFVRLDNEEGRLFLIGIRNATEEVRKEQELEDLKQIQTHARSLEVIKNLSEDFDLVCYADMNTNELTRFHASEVFDRFAKQYPETMSKNARLRKMVEDLIIPEDFEAFRAFSSDTRNYERLMNGGVLTTDFRIHMYGRVVYYRLKMALDETNPNGCVIGFYSIDEQKRQEENTNRLNDMLQERASELEEKNKTLNDLSEGIVELLGEIVESRDEESGEHIHRVKNFAYLLAEQVMKDCPEYGLTEQKVQLIAFASPLHDVGKITVPDAILQKPQKLTEEEFNVMKKHCVAGADLLRKLSGYWTEDYLNLSVEIATYHHEKWDGNGYPYGLSGDAIPISAQIVSIADIFDALISQRCYKPAYTPERAFSMIMNGECGAFSDKLLTSFKKVRSAFFESVDKPLANIDAASVYEGQMIVRSEAQQKTLRNCVNIFNEETNFDRAMNRLLQCVSQYHDADRAYLFEIDYERNTISNTYEYCAPGVESEIHLLQNISSESLAPWIKEFERTGAFYVSKVESSDARYSAVFDLLEMQGITSLLAAPIYRGTEIIGFIGVDNPRHSVNDLLILKTAATLSNSEVLNRMETARATAERRLAVISHLTEDFAGVDYVQIHADKAADVAEEYRINEDIYRLIPKTDETMNFTKRLDIIAKHLVYEYDRDDFIASTRREAILDFFNATKGAKPYTVNFRAVIDGTIAYHQLKFSPDYNKDGTLRGFIVGLQNIDELVRVKEELEQTKQIANRDSMTGVGSAASYASKVREINRRIAEGASEPFAVVECDMNDLKVINDKCGHSFGDTYIRSCSAIICETFTHSPVYRTGGDEFVILLTGEDYENRMSLMAKLRKRALRDIKMDLPINKALSFASGMAIRTPLDTTVQDVFKRADKDMYENKMEIKGEGVR